MKSKVSDLLNKISQLTQQSSFPKISALEYDLVLQHLRDAYEEVIRLKAEAGEGNKSTETIAKETKPKAEPLVEKQQAVKQTNEAVVPKVKSEQPPRFETKNSINETIREGESLNSRYKGPAKEIHHKLSSKPLKELIDLNKRYAVISELFKGDTEACVKAIHQIDVSENYSIAEEYVHSTLFPTFHWKESSETVKLFQSLVKQRFGVE